MAPDQEENMSRFEVRQWQDQVGIYDTKQCRFVCMSWGTMDAQFVYELMVKGLAAEEEK